MRRIHTASPQNGAQQQYRIFGRRIEHESTISLAISDVISIGLKLLLNVRSYLTVLTMVICPFPLETAVVVIVPAVGLNSTGFAINVL